MQIVINHLTRMEAPRMCVAGIDHLTGRHIRPVVGPAHRLTRAMLGTPFTLGALVDIGQTTPVPQAPETEDHLFSPSTTRLIEKLDPQQYLDLLDRHAHADLRAIFGEDLHRQSRSYAVDLGSGAASLGILHPTGSLSAYVDRFDKLRLRLTESSDTLSLPVTDIRLVEADHKTIRVSAMKDLNTRLSLGVKAFLMVGLAHAFPPSGSDRKHWLQVNGICLEDRPLASLP
jgi:hypothetical protein